MIRLYWRELAAGLTLGVLLGALLWFHVIGAACVVAEAVLS